jgi:GNAT superfamily N-acetyltransferase
VADDNVMLRPVGGASYDTAAQLLGRGMRDNPMHAAAIGADPDRRVRVMAKLFARLLPMPGRVAVGAWDATGRLVGVADAAEPGHCQPTGRERLQLVRPMLGAGTAIPRFFTWMNAWSKRDPRRPHSHFGPFAVDLDRQGHGIGTRLLGNYLDTVDDAGLLSYLETDRAENVRLYERYGYVVTSRADVLGVPNWFMERAPR